MRLVNMDEYMSMSKSTFGSLFYTGKVKNTYGFDIRYGVEEKRILEEAKKFALSNGKYKSEIEELLYVNFLALKGYSLNLSIQSNDADLPSYILGLISNEPESKYIDSSLKRLGELLVIYGYTSILPLRRQFLTPELLSSPALKLEFRKNKTLEDVDKALELIVKATLESTVTVKLSAEKKIDYWSKYYLNQVFKQKRN